MRAFDDDSFATKSGGMMSDPLEHLLQKRMLVQRANGKTAAEIAGDLIDFYGSEMMPSAPWSAPISDPMGDLRRWQKTLADLPPVVHKILASPLVPEGEFRRQWDARGRLLLWVNSLWLRRAMRMTGEAIPASVKCVMAPPVFGIPVHFVDQEHMTISEFGYSEGWL